MRKSVQAICFDFKLHAWFFGEIARKGAKPQRQLDLLLLCGFAPLRAFEMAPG